MRQIFSDALAWKVEGSKLSWPCYFYPYKYVVKTRAAGCCESKVCEKKGFSAQPEETQNILKQCVTCKTILDHNDPCN